MTGPARKLRTPQDKTDRILYPTLPDHRDEEVLDVFHQTKTGGQIKIVFTPIGALRERILEKLAFHQVLPTNRL